MCNIKCGQIFHHYRQAMLITSIARLSEKVSFKDLKKLSDCRIIIVPNEIGDEVEVVIDRIKKRVKEKQQKNKN